MKKLGIIFMIVALMASFSMTGCKKGSSSGEQSEVVRSTAPKMPSELPAPPAGTERVFLCNGALIVYKFTLPAGQKWSNYNKMTAEFMVDADNLTRNLRSGAVRLLGNYQEADFEPDEVWVGEDIIETLNVSLSTDEMFAHKILDNHNTTWEAMGAAADEWFLYTYDITGSRAHSQFNKENIPAANATGPFYFALGLSSQDEGKRNGIVSLIRNVTLHHATNPALNVVSTGSGFDKATSAAYFSANVDRVTGPAQ